MSVDAQRNRIRRNLGIEGPRKGNLIAVGGSVTTADGRYYVQYQDRSIDKLKARGAFQVVAGTPVLTRFDPDTRQYVIIGQDSAVTGGNSATFTGNPLDPRNQPPITARGLNDLLPRILGSTLTLTVGALSAPLHYQGDWYPFAGANIDLSAAVPATADTHRYAVVGYYPPFGKLYALTSTPISTGIELGGADIDEAWATRTRPLIPVAAVALAAGQTAISQGDVEILRQLINTDTERGSDTGFLPRQLTGNSTVIVSENEQTIAVELVIGATGTLIIDGLVQITGATNARSGSPARTVTEDATISPLDDTVLVDASTGPVTVTLPPAATCVQRVYVKAIDVGGGPVTIATNGAETIDGAAHLSVTFQWTSFTLTSDGSDWFIL